MGTALKLTQGDAAQTRLPDSRLPACVLTDPSLSTNAKILIWALSTWAWGEKNECFPSNRAIQERIGKNARWIQRAFNDAIVGGYVERVMVPTKAGWRRSVRLTFRPDVLKLIDARNPRDKSVVTVGAGGDTSDATPLTLVSPPHATPVTPELFESSEEKKGIGGGTALALQGPAVPANSKGEKAETPRRSHVLDATEHAEHLAVKRAGVAAGPAYAAATWGLILHARAVAALARGETLPD